MIDLALSSSRRQHGLVTLDQVRAAGRSRSAWFRAHQSGLLVPVHPGVSRLAAIESTAEQAIHAAVLAGDGLASHLSAARLWGAEVAGVDPVDLTVSDRRRFPRLAGVRLHRPLDLADLHPVVRAGIKATNPLRTCLDAGAVCAPEPVAAIVEAFIIKRYVTVRMLRTGLRRHSQRGREGLGTLRLVLDDWALADKPPDSVLEPAMARLLRDHRLPTAVFHHVVRCGGHHFELDFGVLDHRVDVEVDGWTHHSDRRAFEADHERDAYLVGAGWAVLRFTWYQVRFRPHWVANRIRDTIAARS